MKSFLNPVRGWHVLVLIVLPAIDGDIDYRRSTLLLLLLLLWLLFLLLPLPLPLLSRMGG